MKVAVTQTELKAFPNIAWDKLCAFLFENPNDLTPTQQAIHIGLWYFSEAAAGFADLFGKHPNLSRPVVSGALNEMGGDSFAENFLAAASIFEEAAANNAAADFTAVDGWFNERRSDLLDVVYDFHLAHTSELFEIVDEDYEMRIFPGVFTIGAICAGFFLVLTVVFALLNPEDWWLIAIVFGSFTALGVFLMVFAKGWHATVTKDTITVRSPLRRPKIIRIHDITDVRRRSDTIAIYINNNRRKALSIEHSTTNFGMLIGQLSAAGKLREIQTDSIFTIRSSKVEKGTAIGFFVLTLLVSAGSALSRDFIAEKLFFFVVFLFFTYNLIDKLKREIEVTGSQITVRRPFRKSRELLARDITSVTVSEADITIYAGKKKVAAVDFKSQNCSSLEWLLRNNNIPFTKNGKPV